MATRHEKCTGRQAVAIQWGSHLWGGGTTYGTIDGLAEPVVVNHWWRDSPLDGTVSLIQPPNSTLQHQPLYMQHS